MRVAIFGTGYMGLATGTCLASVGHRVPCVDIGHAKGEGLDRGMVLVNEPGLAKMAKAGHARGRVRFGRDAAAAGREYPHRRGQAAGPGRRRAAALAMPANRIGRRDAAATIAGYLGADVEQLRSGLGIAAAGPARDAIGRGRLLYA